MIEQTPQVGLAAGNVGDESPYSTPLLLKVWSLGQQHQHHLMLVQDAESQAQPSPTKSEPAFQQDPS